MRLLLSVVIFIGLVFSTYGQSDFVTDVGVEDYPYSDDNIPDNETLVLKNHAFGRDLDTDITTEVFKDISAEKGDDEIVDGVEDENFDACGSPPLIEFAKTDRKKKPPYAIGTELAYSCDLGYSADGASHTSACTQSSDDRKPTWTDPHIICIPRSCGEPGYVPNAHRTGSRYTFPNSVSFECDVGYVLKGSSTRYCQVNGRWSGSLPSCEEVFCDQPKHPENGRVTFTSLEYRSKLKYECDSGYLLKNHQQPRVCLETGSWSGPEPTCQEAKCEKPIAPDHGFVEIAGKPRIGSIAFYTCEPGRLLVGSGTSKCLDTGEWMFEAPKCVDPCNVPSVPNGLVGKYEKSRNRQKYFTQLPSGTVTGVQDELFLRCDNKYEPMGENKPEVKVECKEGLWKKEPVCKPAKCRGNPPAMRNGIPARIGREHGQYVVYHCVQHTTKTVYGNVTCRHGQWQGVTPTCTDERCYIDKITFPGLLKGKKNVYLSGESFTPVCEKGYDVVDPQNEFTCKLGNWEGQFPPCIAASCLSAPPTIQNGRIKSYTERHSSLVEYECDEGYILQGPSQVQCLFGEWKNKAPVCKDSQCYFKNLKLKSGMIIPSKDPVSSGETIDVKCMSGFSPLNIKPVCSKGAWNEFETSPCQPNDCYVHVIRNGALTHKTVTTRFLRQPKVSYKAENIGTRFKAGSSLYVSCIHSTTFHGKNMNDVPTECIRGKWKPSPVCLPYGTIYKEDEESSVDSDQMVEVPELPRTTTTSAALPRQALHTASPQEEILNPTETMERKSGKDEDCFCLYRGSNSLVAHAGQELLQYGSRVKSNCSVKLYCNQFGYDHFIGPKEMKCENCRTWNSSEYPTCVRPQSGNTVLAFDPSIAVIPGGIVTVDQGSSPHIECFGNRINQYPVWISNVDSSLWTSYGVHNYESGGYRLSTYLQLHRVSSQHNGFYRCFINGYAGQEIQIQVKPQCVAFDETEEFRVHYERGQKVGSNAIFSCKDRSKKLEGSGTLTCMSNGEWSGKQPKCVSIGCRALNESEGMRIDFSDGLNVRSTATFHCLVPRIRKGNVFISCLPNGEWSGNMPSCTLQNCPVEEIMENLPSDVVPHLEGIDDETVPPGFEVPLVCEGDLRLSKPLPVKCGENGKWEVPPIRCIQGCYFIETPSDLILDPKMDFYRFGEIVALSCAPGQILSSKVEILMCLRDGWSEEIPFCKDEEIPEIVHEENTKTSESD